MNVYRLGVDIGGTFTDIVLLDENGVLRNKKILSSPDDYSRAIEEGVRELLNTTGVKAGEIVELAHGTTVATNAIIERKGVTVALITTAGFRDVLEIARFRAPRLYDVNFRKPDPLVERRLRFTVPERITASGEVNKPIDIAALIAVADRCRDADVDALAVCFINAYVNPQHEEAARCFLVLRVNIGIDKTDCECIDISVSTPVGHRNQGGYIDRFVDLSTGCNALWNSKS